MKKEQSKLKENINKAMETPLNRGGNEEQPIPSSNINEDRETTYKASNNHEQPEGRHEEKPKTNQYDKPLKIFGGICLAIAVAALIFTGTTTPDTSQSAADALKNQVSTAVSTGTILLSEDQNIGAKDYTITHKSNAKETKIWVWDYAAEDGDYVQVLVNGVPAGDAFMIRHKPREITVPSTGTVQVKGVKDGGGGITYAVRYDINGTSYFNGTPEGQFNTYNLKLQE
jgi:hypothetical protein